VELFSGQLERPESCRAMLDRCDTVVHAAAPLVGSVSSLFARGVVPTRVLVDAAATVGVDRFLLVSSMGVYGTANLAAGAVLDERCPVDPHPELRDPYSYSKIAQEGVCWEAFCYLGTAARCSAPGSA
jgi:nucleoside-diphosphate-sugar epimerase